MKKEKNINKDQCHMFNDLRKSYADLKKGIRERSKSNIDLIKNIDSLNKAYDGKVQQFFSLPTLIRHHTIKLMIKNRTLIYYKN